MKKLIALQLVGCIVFACIILILYFTGIFSVFSVILTYVIMGAANVLNATKLLLKPIEELSEHDRLTGCHNRVRLDVRIPEYEKHDSYAVIFFDINNFKKINDTHGHDDGDRLLIKASDQLRFWFSYGDLYRIGGDEFIVVVPNLSRAELTRLVGKWYREQPVLNEEYNDSFECKFSYGMKFKEDGMSFDDVMNAADELMYEMKKQEMRNAAIREGYTGAGESFREDMRSIR